MITHTHLIALPEERSHNVKFEEFRRPIIESHRICITILVDDDKIHRQAFDDEAVSFLFKPSGPNALCFARDIVHCGEELFAMNVDQDAALEKVGLVEAKSVVIIVAVFVVGKGEFAVVVRFLSEVELVGVVVAGVRFFAVCDFSVPAINTSIPATASKDGERAHLLISSVVVVEVDSPVVAVFHVAVAGFPRALLVGPRNEC